ncbi:MAG: glycerol-3-phosphate dehydrogenase/oxidase [Candidatus Thorarchaeota archaeon]
MLLTCYVIAAYHPAALPMNAENSSLFAQYTAIDRRSQLERLARTEWDLIVIGGGITGAGIAREATLRGLTVALLEQSDFASGTSSGSSKLGHGGIRYLKQRDFRLVREATTERNWLRDEALPHMVRPLQFIYPVFRGREAEGQQIPQSKERLRTVRLAVFLYDFLCGFHNYASREVITDPKHLKKLEPAFSVTGLTGAVLYYDTNLDDARLTLETVWESLRTGKACAVNYIKVIDLMRDASGNVNGVIAVDQADEVDQKQLRIKGKALVNATGVWADKILSIGETPENKLVRPTKGVHLAVRRTDLPVNHAFGIRSIDDGRFFFVLPRNNWALIGTTDTDFSGEPTDCYCTEEDAEYLRRTVRILFQGAKIENDRLLGSYASLRPLAFDPGKSESSVSRKHLILQTSDGLLTIVGGKLTTFRKMAENLLLNHIKPRIKKGFPKFLTQKGLSKTAYWVAITQEDWEESEEVAVSKLDPAILHHLFEQYGKGGLQILQNIKVNLQMANRLLDECPATVCPWILGEIEYIVKRECPVHLDDVLFRRMEIAWLVRPEHQGKVARSVAEYMGKILGWSKERIEAEIYRYVDLVKLNSFFYKGEIPVPGPD